jgi:alkylation response protein AidB-like acyl-CoA dehydrogenase
MSENNQAIRGGEFLIRETSAADIFIPEEWTEEQLMMKQMTLDFVKQRIIPQLERIEMQEEGLLPSLMEEAGELGLIGSSVPE